MNDLNKTGKCIIFSAPSGAGKTTIVRHLLEVDSRLEFSISACSREPRVGEVDGKDYYFLGIDGFKKAVGEGAFIEWEEVYNDNFYGTMRSEMERIWAKGKTVIFDVDVIGGLNIKKRFGDQALSIFVQPPNEGELENRLRYRSTETEEKIQMRMAKAKQELAENIHFDKVLLNEKLDTAFAEARELVSNFLAK
jgi:guanylate kinase